MMGGPSGRERGGAKVPVRNPAYSISLPTVEHRGFAQTVCSHGDPELTALSISQCQLQDID